MSKPKTPTASGISRLLAAAGFERAKVTSKGRNQYANTAGFHVKARLGNEVLVNHWGDSAEMPSGATRDAGRQMLIRYGDVIRAAGWPVEDRNHMLTVTAKED
jgi:hypothetical protein